MDCFECGKLAEHNHHVVPRVRGGTKTVSLCTECHSKAHHLNKKMSAPELIKEGMRKARERGVFPGIPRKHNYQEIVRMRNCGVGVKEIAMAIGSSKGRISTILKGLKSQITFKGLKPGRKVGFKPKKKA